MSGSLALGQLCDDPRAHEVTLEEKRLAVSTSWDVLSRKSQMASGISISNIYVLPKDK